MTAPPDAAGPDEDDRPTRERLLDAAYELLVDEGYRAATVQNVVRRAGSSNGALYGQFATRHDLLLAAVLRHEAFADPAEAGEPAYRQGVPAERPGAALEALVGRLAAHLAEPPGPVHRLITELAGAALADDADETPLRIPVHQLHASVGRAVDAAGAAGEAGGAGEGLPDDALTAVLVAIYLGAVTAKALGMRPPRREDVEQVLRACLVPAG